jgi:hypothetical protein
MSGYTGQEIGQVIAFVKTTFAQGTTIADLLPGLTDLDKTPQVDVGKLALGQLIRQKDFLVSANLSEITTDRLSAGLEVITPRVIASELNVDTIKSATGSAVALQLTSDGEFVIKDEDGEEKITFDSQGNAFFAGTITTDKIKANQIEGLEIFTDRIRSLEGNIAAAAAFDAGISTNSASLSLTVAETSVSLKDLEGLISEVKNLSSKVDLLTSTASLSAIMTQSINSNFADVESLGIKDATISGKLTVLGRSLLSDVGITGNVNMGVISINGLGGEINTLSGQLKIQSEGLGGIDILNGKIVIDTKGNLISQGEITAKKINIDESDAGSKSVGSVTIKSGETEFEITTTALTSKSRIFATPDKPVAVGASMKDSTTIRIKLKEKLSEDVRVNWWIVN